MKTKTRAWWSRPITSRNRFYAAITGAFGGFWILLIGRIGLGATPVGLDMLLAWAVGGVVVGAVLGLAAPKVIRVVLFPFMYIGGGSIEHT